MVVLFLPFSNALKLSKLKELSEAPNHQKKVFNEMITGWLQSCSDSKKGKEPCGKYFDFSHRGAGTREYVHEDKNREKKTAAIEASKPAKLRRIGDFLCFENGHTGR